MMIHRLCARDFRVGYFMMGGQLLVTGWRASRIGQEQSETMSAGHRRPEADVWTGSGPYAFAGHAEGDCEAGMHATMSFIG
jgi:hypothetical protein